jgi:hypothetical protein
MTALCLTIFGCKLKPTYKATEVDSDLKKMVAHDYHMNVETRRSGNNLQTFFWRVGLLRAGQLEMQPEAAEALERVLLCATRITLSTDAPLQFLEVKMADGLTGATVTLWRFVPDIRDSMYTRLAEDEYVNRLVVEFDAEDVDRQSEWKEVKWDPPITMSQFLAKQVILRVKRQSPVGLQVHEDVSQPSQLVVVLDNWPAIERQGMRQEEKVTDLLEKTARIVVKNYRYTGFREIVLKNHNGVPLKSWAL